jgi:hypothetical protein
MVGGYNSYCGKNLIFRDFIPDKVLFWAQLITMLKFLLLLSFCLVAAGCSFSDPRLPAKLYEDALALSQDGRTLEAKALMEEIALRFPEKPEGMSAKQQIFMLDVLIGRSIEDEKKQARHLVRATADALNRYKARHGEYPPSLHRLVPEYGLDQIPMTPWKHPLFYRPYVSVPHQTVMDKRRRTSIRTNTKFDSYHLACFGKNLRPGGRDMDADILVVNGKVIQEKVFPTIPSPQPYR